jgi:hypothetical protein
MLRRLACRGATSSGERAARAPDAVGALAGPVRLGRRGRAGVEGRKTSRPPGIVRGASGDGEVWEVGEV